MSTRKKDSGTPASVKGADEIGASPPSVVFIAFGLAISMVAMFGVFAFPVYFDEVAQLNHLYHFSLGLKPHSDFWCMYPASGYVLFNLFFGQAAHSSFVLVGLRIFSVALFGVVICLMVIAYRRLRVSPHVFLALILAYLSDPKVLWSTVQFKPDPISAVLVAAVILLLLLKPSVSKFAGAGLLATLSVFIMPKGIYFLTVAMVLCLWESFRALRWKGVGALVGSCFLGVFVIHLMCLAAGTTLWEDLKYSHILVFRMSERSAQAIAEMKIGGLVSFFQSVFLPFLARNAAFSIALLASIVWWLLRFREAPAVNRMAGIAVLAGSILYLWKTKFPYDQYLNPLWLPATVFPALALSLVPDFRVRRRVSAAAVVILTGVAIGRFPFMTGPESAKLGAELRDYHQLETMLGEDDRVLAAPVFPPMKRSLMFVTCDQVGPGFAGLIGDPAIRHEFTAEALSTALASKTPALIMEGINYPKEWYPVISDYLSANAEKYQRISVAGWSGFLLKERLRAGEPVP